MSDQGRRVRRNILITGASAGLGEQMAWDFAAKTRNLALCARRVDRLEALRERLEYSYPALSIVHYGLDVNDHGRVFEVFRESAEHLGGLDRVIVNAGIGKGQPVGTGGFDANLQTVQTNFVAALAQCEAAMEIFRAQGHGHLVLISSMSALRGMPRNLTTYAATKAGVSTLAEGIRAETLDSEITVSAIHPGYIRSEMNARVRKTPLIADTKTGVRSMVAAIEREVAAAYVPRWPWAVLRPVMTHLPLRLVARWV
jgi:short-subunit dehydrogenase